MALVAGYLLPTHWHFAIPPIDRRVKPIIRNTFGSNWSCRSSFLADRALVPNTGGLLGCDHHPYCHAIDCCGPCRRLSSPMASQRCR